jgi:YggT family protein
MFYEPLRFLIRNLAGFFILILLLRFYLQVVRAPFGHPLAQFTVKLTNFAVLPLRRIVPSVGGYDTATLLLAWVTALLMNLLLIVASPFPINLLAPMALAGLAVMAVLSVIEFSLYLLLGAVFMQAVLSWVNPYQNPLTPLLDALTRPFLNPIRRVIHPVGGIDLSPLVLMLVLTMILQYLIPQLEPGLFAFTLAPR